MKYLETSLGELHHCSCVDFLESNANRLSGQIKALITDPPYGIALSSSGSGCRKTSLWSEIENLATVFLVWMGQASPMLEENAFVAVFSNYKGIPAVYKSMLKCGFSIFNAVVWDKECVGAGLREFRRSYELIAIGATGKAEVKDRTRRDVFRHSWQSQMGVSGHPAEKPLSLLRWLIESMTEPGDLVLDPFIGSGTTAVACEELGRRWIGVEIEEEHCRTAAKRIEESASSARFFT